MTDKKSGAFLREIMSFALIMISFHFLGLVNNYFLDIVYLVFVFILHESAHILAKTLFRYKPYHPFYIPSPGELNTENTKPTSTETAIMVIAGPIGGLFFGLLFFLASGAINTEVFGRLTYWSVLFNLVSLLPIYPLDGSRFFAVIGLGVFKYYSIIQKALTVVFLSWTMSFEIFPEAIVFLIFVIFLQIEKTLDFREITEDVVKDMGELTLRDSPQIKDGYMKKIKKLLKERVYPNSSYEPEEAAAETLWRRLKYRRPSLYNLILLLGVYILSVGMSFNYVVEHTEILKEEKNMTVLSRKSDYYVLVRHKNGKPSVVGKVANYRRIGVWSLYTKKGMLEFKYVYQNDELKSVIKFSESRIDTIKFDEIDIDEKANYHEVLEERLRYP